ncbi:cbxX/CfqX [Artemisia annua]|uniref:CbxX/CfqX n=1 Tax=Artemisia annua TaxID=35608 RepID=A0A2U1LBZ1_ARTAN|nr:cbxX/CfqX [Artemisia annua]
MEPINEFHISSIFISSSSIDYDIYDDPTLENEEQAKVKNESQEGKRKEKLLNELHAITWSKQCQCSVEVVKYLRNLVGTETVELEAKNMKIWRNTIAHGCEEWLYFRLLLSHGASTEAKANNGMTPLHLSVWHSLRAKDSSIVKTLLEHNADCVDDSSLYKWKVGFDNNIVSPNLVSYNYSNNTNELCESTGFSNDAFRKKVHIPFQCLKDVIVRHRMLLYFIKEFPLLERVAIIDSLRLNCVEVPVSVSTCYVDVLDLGRSGCVMRDVTFVVMEMSEDIGSVTGDYESGV